MSEAIFSDIYDRIDQLNRKEKELRAEMAEVRRERARLKAQCPLQYLSERPSWLSNLPAEVWYPSYYANKILSDLNPSLEQRNVPPDLIDWSRTSGIKEFLINCGITAAVVILGLQFLVILL
jgi:hypothetical protein